MDVVLLCGVYFFFMWYLILAVLLVACGSSEEAYRALPPYTVDLPADATQDLIIEVNKATNAWNAALRRDVFKVARPGVSAPNLPNHIYVHFGTTGGAGQTTTDDGFTFYVGVRPDSLVGWATLTHEFGHCLGLVDEDEEGTLMYRHLVNGPQPTITESDVDEVVYLFSLLGFEM